jgi:hypothetical protein
MKERILLILLLGFSQLAFCQEGLDLRQSKEVEAALNESYYHHLASRPYIPGVTNLEELKTQLEVDIKSSLAKKIISRVRLEDKSKSVSLSVRDQGNVKNNSLKEVTNFEFNSNIESEITFSDLKPLFQEDAKNRRLYGLVYINKENKIIDAHKKIYAILSEEMKNIIHSLEIKIN